MSLGVFIIAEAGVNHNGDYETALKLVDKAIECGVDCIKFQTFKAHNLVSASAPKAEYQKRTTDADESQYEMIKKLELSYVQFKALKAYCEEKGVMFLSTAFDLESISFLDALDILILKIPSGEITNLPYLIAVAKTGRDVILSTGMADISEIGAAISVLKKNGCGEITVLHCTTEYPTPFCDVNLKAMQTIRDTFSVKIGYSDHTKGIEVPIAAVAMGATVIEKHFTLDRNMLGPDHKASLEPDELKAMVDAIRNIEVALGDGVKQPAASEIKNMAVARKSIVARKIIKAGQVFTEDNLAVKRPGNGITPMKWFDVIGQVAKRDFEEDELIIL